MVELKKIGPYLKFIKGKAPSLTFEEFKDGLKPYLSPEYLRGVSQPLYVAPNGKLVTVEDGEIIVLWDGSNAGEIFTSKDGILASTMTKVAVDETEFDRKYFIYSMQYLEYILKAKTAGSGIPHVDKGILKNLEVYKPAISEQRKIASILTKVDNAIQAVKITIEKAERLKKSLMQNLLTGKLKPDGTWRSANDFYETKLGLIPNDWSLDKLGSITNNITDGEHISPDFQKDGSYIFSAEDIYEDGIHLNNAKYVKPDDCIRFRKRCNPDFGDVLIVSRGASIGRTCRVNIKDIFCLMGSVILLKANENVLSSSYISSYLKSYFAWKELRRISGTTAQQAIYLVHLQKLRIAYPNDKDEQKQIADKIGAVESIITSKFQKIQKLERLKKALMQNLLTGKVPVKI